MKPADLFLYLLGNRGAIERVASSRRALWAGVLLVLGAGIARNYDHLYLLAEPEWIYGPFGMSLFSAVFIWLILRADISFVRHDGKNPTFRTFLTLFWLTAPCAWLYGVPVERFMDLVWATKWNFAFLIVVAAWRVALIVRAVTVLTGAAAGRVLAFVLLPACVEMFAGSLLKGLSLIGIMGGVRLPPHHAFLKKASDVVVTGSFWLGVFCLTAMLVYTFKADGRAVKPLWRERTTESAGVIVAAAACLVTWVLIAVPVQGPVSGNYHLNRFFTNKQWREGIAFAAVRQRSDFSPIHFLPPDPYRSKPGSRCFPLLKALDGSEPDWLRKVWISQAVIEMDGKWNPDPSDKSIMAVLSRYPEIMTFLEQKAVALKARSDLNWAEEKWLLDYQKKAVPPAQPSKSAPP